MRIESAMEQRDDEQGETRVEENDVNISSADLSAFAEKISMV